MIGRNAPFTEDDYRRAVDEWRVLLKDWDKQICDNVNRPSHYVAGGIETIDFLRAKLTPEQFEGFCIGNAMKYLSRAGKKNDAAEDRKKAEWYLTHLRTGSKMVVEGGD